MKKRILLLIGVVSVLGMTGCFDKKKTLKCFKTFDIGSTEEITFNFTNDYLKKQSIKTSIAFDNEEQAKMYYDELTMYGAELILDGNLVSEANEYTYEEKSNEYLYSNLKKDYIDKGYECK